MNYLWDTNILLYSLRKLGFLDTIKRQYGLDDTLSNVYISIVTVGEIHSLALRNSWGKNRMALLYKLLDSLTAIFVDDNPDLIQMYSEIDNYSQNHHPTLRMTGSARKMGKNDLWIAATAAVAQATLISPDDDFTHLNGLFLFFDKIVV